MNQESQKQSQHSRESGMSDTLKFILGGTAYIAVMGLLYLLVSYDTDLAALLLLGTGIFCIGGGLALVFTGRGND